MRSEQKLNAGTREKAPTAIEIESMDAALGAEIRCGDLRVLDNDGIAAIRAAWLEHLVVVFRGQTLSDAELIAFVRRFGEQTEECPRRRVGERAAGGVVDFDIPAAQFGGDAARQLAVRRHQRRRHTRRFERPPQ